MSFLALSEYYEFNFLSDAFVEETVKAEKLMRDKSGGEGNKTACLQPRDKSRNL